MSFALPDPDHEELRLHHKRAWLFDQIGRAMRKRRYPQLVPEHDPSYPRWRIIVPEIIGGIGVAVVIGLAGLAVLYLQPHWNRMLGLSEPPPAIEPQR